MTGLLEEYVRFEEVYGASWFSVAIRLLLDDTEGALQKLAEVADDKDSGLYDRLIIERSSVFDPIRSEPAYVALLEANKRIAEQQRRLLEEMNL